MIVVRQNLVLQLSKFIIHILKYKIDAIVLFLSASVTILLSIHQRMIFILTGKKKKNHGCRRHTSYQVFNHKSQKFQLAFELSPCQ